MIGIAPNRQPLKGEGSSVAVAESSNRLLASKHHCFRQNPDFRKKVLLALAVGQAVPDEGDSKAFHQIAGALSGTA